MFTGKNLNNFLVSIGAFFKDHMLVKTEHNNKSETKIIIDLSELKKSKKLAKTKNVTEYSKYFF